MREYQLCSKFGWTYRDCREVPPLVLETFYLYASIEEWVSKNKG